jgi:hypothetical protein
VAHCTEEHVCLRNHVHVHMCGNLADTLLSCIGDKPACVSSVSQGITLVDEFSAEHVKLIRLALLQSLGGSRVTTDVDFVRQEGSPG